ncbi:30S ribosomal protein S6 [Patescibacteria group bacterium]|nr:30S ribosomal protein S6 [Patescibacteria group bacterium]
MTLLRSKPAADTDLDDQESDIRLYECSILYPFPLNQKEEKEIIDGVEEIFKEAGAREVEKDLWGRRGLAYPIKGHNEGSFVIYHLEIDPSKIKGINEALNIMHGVLRHLLLKPPAGYQITKLSDGYKKWLDERETVEERRESEKEAKLERHVMDKAKRHAKRVEDKKKENPSTEKEVPIEKDKLAEELEKLISDDELNL